MEKIAFIFSGQGAQKVGMGREFLESSAFCRKLVEKADKIMDGGFTDICLKGTQEELDQTIHTQPCLFVMEMMAYTAIVERGIRPIGVAGFSLGEYGALATAGCFDLSVGLDLVMHRARWMQQAAKENPGGMVAVLGLSDRQVIDACNSVQGAWPVNFNCEKQVVVAGTNPGLEAAQKALSERGGKLKRLAVSGGFHSPLMDGAAEQFQEYIQKVNIRHPEKEIFLNVDADLHAGNMRSFMAAQINSPVRWRQTIENMIAHSYDTFVEIGPGKTLSGMMRRIDKGVRVFNVEDMQSLEKTVNEIGVKPWGAQ